MATQMERAIFAGGCFWCMVKPFHKYEGVTNVMSGYTGGHTVNPTYKEVCSETTGHYEAVEITFDPTVISYEQLLTIFWQQIDPTDAGGQFFDRGQSYQTAIFYTNEQQKTLAEKSKTTLNASGTFSQSIKTEILEAKPFYEAEDYHQDYYLKNPAHYERYQVGSGRKGFIEKHWGNEE